MNRSIKSLWLAAFGLSLNAFAMATNGTQMPVSRWALERAGLSDSLVFIAASSDAVHKLVNEHTRFWYLTDVIPMPLFHNVVSVGDVFLMLGLVFFFPEVTRRVAQRRRA